MRSNLIPAIRCVVETASVLASDFVLLPLKLNEICARLCAFVIIYMCMYVCMADAVACKLTQIFGKIMEKTEYRKENECAAFVQI